MTRRGILAITAICLGLASMLFLHAALQRLPFGQWPALPLDPARMSMDQIILAFGLFPRAAVAMLAGAALGLSGAILQQLLRNPIAEPSTLGISAGAQLAVVACTLFFPAIMDGYRSLVAFSGAGAAAILVFLLGWRRAFEPVTMVVSGLLIGVTAGALSAALTLSQGEYLMSLVTWNGGSLSQQDWSTARRLGGEVLAGLVLTALLVRPLTVLGLGDTGAKSLGASLTLTRFLAATVAVGLAASVAAAVGLVSFIGLAAPALVRAIGIRRPAAVIFASPLAGGLLLWICDGGVQFIATTMQETFPTGAVTALIGGPLLLWLLPKVRAGEVARDDSGNIVSRRSARQLSVIAAGLVLAAILALAIGKGAGGWHILDTAAIGDLLPLRWPRLMAAAAAGALLAVTGTVLQRMTGNPMASPEVIGVSGGAGLGFAAAVSLLPAAGALELMTASGLGALAVMVVVLSFASRRHLSPERLLLAGIAMGSLSSSVLAALLAIGDQRSWLILAWLGGSASAATPQTAVLLAVMAVGVLIAGLSFGRWLTILPLGQAVPLSLGLPLRRARTVMILVCGVATGAASLLVGPLSFVGLVAPHIALRAGFTRTIPQILAAFLLGALLMILADLGARTATFPYELPLGLFAALAGAPYLIWLIGRR